MNPDLIQRALMHYAVFLEQERQSLNRQVETLNSDLESLARFLWPDSDPLKWADSDASTIMEELKRRGLGNGKVGE